MTHVDAILARLLALHPKRIDLSLDRMWRILDALGHPERRLPPGIHVAGTNGKGSTVAFMRAMLEAAGKSVHVYTSPNLVRLNERFRLGRPGGGVLVEDDGPAPPAPRGRGPGRGGRARRDARRMRALQRRAADHRVGDRDRRRPHAVRAPSRRR